MYGPDSNLKRYAERLKNNIYFGTISREDFYVYVNKYEEPSETTRQSPTHSKKVG
jgi:hypothetical protein